MPDGETLVYEYAERGQGAYGLGVVMVQHGLTPESMVDAIIDGDENFRAFQYFEELELLFMRRRRGLCARANF